MLNLDPETDTAIEPIDPQAMVLPVWEINDATIQRLREAAIGAHIVVLPAWDDDYKSAKVAPVKEAVNA
jgi:hypothetical protein